MALSLGSLFVKLNADTSGLTQGLEGAGQKIAQFGQKVEGITSKFGAIGVAMAAFGANAVRIGAQLDAGVGTAVTQMQTAFNDLNTQIAQALLPVIQKIGQVIQWLANAFRDLSPAQKEFLAGIGSAVAIGLTLGATVGKVMGALSALAPVVSAIGSGISTLAPIFQGAMSLITGVLAWPLAALGAIIAILPLLFTAWDENWGGIRDIVASVVKYIATAWDNLTSWLMDVWTKFTEWFSGKSSSIGKALKGVFDWILRQFMQHLARVADVVKGIAKVFNVDISNSVNAFKDTVIEIGDRGFDGLVKDATAGAAMFVDKYSKGIDIIKNKAKSMMPSFSLPNLPAVTTPGAKPAVPGAVGAGKPINWGTGGIDMKGVVDTQKELAKANQSVVETNYKLKASFAELSAQAMHVPADMMKNITDSFAEAMKAQDWEAATGILDNLKELENGFASAAEEQMKLAQQIRDKAAEALGSIVSTIQGKFGALQEIGQMASQGAQAGMAAGPAGAVAGGIIGGFMAMLMQSKNFQRIVDQTAIMFGGLFEVFGELLAPIADLMTAVNVVNSRQNLPMLRDAFKKLADVLRFFLLIFNDALFALNSIIGKAMFLIADAIGWLLPEVANNLRNFGNMILDGLEAERDEFAQAINGAQYSFADGMNKVDDSATKAAAGLDALTGAIGNAPTGFKLAGYKYNLGEPVGDFTPLQINISVDGKEMQARVMEVNRRAYFIQTGGFLPPRP